MPLPALALGLTLLAPAAHAAELPGVPLTFVEESDGRWVTGADLPKEFRDAGVEPGWTLARVEGRKLDDLAAVRRAVASGPARTIQLQFDVVVPPADGAAPAEGEDAPKPVIEEVLVVVPRAPLVQVEEVGVLPWPQGFAADGARWVSAGPGRPVLLDGARQAWRLNPSTGALTRFEARPVEVDATVTPEVWWHLTSAPWVRLDAEGLPVLDRDSALGSLGAGLRLGSFQGAPGEHLVSAEADGLVVRTVAFPAGTPALPTCSPDVPESCLVAGREIAATLLDKPGGRALATEDLGVACDAGVYRACLEAVALAEPDLQDPALACVERDVNACHALGRTRLERQGDTPDTLMVGALEFACTVDASGSLGERLRRLEDVGEGCMMLSRAFDARGTHDRALLSLDQACVLGRADACEEAGRRRAEAFALKTVTECEDPDLPLASACVQLGLLLQRGPVSATELDDFSAFERACALGDEEGCKLLGDYVDRWGIAHPRVVGAERSLRDACDQGEQKACIGTGHLLVRHEPKTEDYGEALVLFDAACDAGLPTGCIAGAEQRRIGKARKVEVPEQLGMWGAACDLGSAPGCAGLGDELSRKKTSWEEAFVAWTKACDTGEASACTDLGKLVENKHDPWPGELERDAYLNRGCDNDDAEGCFWLAEDDLPRKGDPPEPAYLLLEQSCDGEYGDACAELGRIHLQRRTSFDDEIAAGKLEQACESGHFESCKTLGEMYQKGKGVEKDRLRAKELAQKFAINARRKHIRLGAQIGFPYLAGGNAEVVLPIPVGPALSATGSYAYVPMAAGVLNQLQGDEYPDDAPDLVYYDAGVRLYPNNKARGLYGMVGVHRLMGVGGTPPEPRVREGGSVRFGMYNENRFLWSRVEMGLGSYGNIDLHDFDEDEEGKFPFVQATLGLSFGVAFL